MKKNPRIHIPIIGNGDITSVKDAYEHFDKYGVDAVMIGRATFGCPWLFSKEQDALTLDDTVKLEEAHQKGIERTLFPNLTQEEECVVAALTKQNDLQVNLLSIQSGVSISTLTGILFGLEMKGVVKMLAGGVYHLYTL